MGTAIFALLSHTDTALNTRAIIGAALMVILVMLAVTHYRTNVVIMRLLFGLFVATIIVTSLVLGITAFNHVNSITSWSTVRL